MELGFFPYSGDMNRMGEPPLTVTPYWQAIRFVIFVGAAYHDATEDQRQKLNDKLPPLLDIYKETGREALVRIAIRDILGQQWAPSGDYKKQIDELRGGQ